MSEYSSGGKLEIQDRYYYGSETDHDCDDVLNNNSGHFKVSMHEKEVHAMQSSQMSLIIAEQQKMIKTLSKEVAVLQQSEQKYRGIFNNINAYIYIHDLKGDYIETNAHFKQNTGYTEDELKKFNIKDFIPRNYHKQTDDYIRRTVSGGHDTGLLNVVTKDGNTRVVEYTSSLIEDETGPKAIRGLARDITEEFRAKNALEKSEENLRIAHDGLEKQVKKRTKELKQAYRQLEEETANLADANVAMRFLLNQKDEAKKEVEEKLLVNIKELVLPLVTKMRLSKLPPYHKSYLELIEKNLHQAISPFAVSIDSKYYKLSAMELQIANLIKDGNTTKEIVGLLGISKSTVNTYRNRIRVKLGIKNKKVNLRTYLLKLQK